MDTSAYSTIHIGKKVRDLRKKAGMTQTELAGDMITRNMLSRLEHGAALPSLETLIHLAVKLEVSPAYLLSSGVEDDKYRILDVIDSIKTLYTRGEYEPCLALCESLETEDEMILHFIFMCHYHLAENARELMHLNSAFHHYKAVTESCGSDVCVSKELQKKSAFYLTLMENVKADILPESLFTDDFCADPEYLLFLEAYMLSRTDRADFALVLKRIGMIRSTVLSQMLDASIAFAEKDILSAIPKFRAVLASRDADFYVRYHALYDLEKCFELMDNFKDAYALSKERLALTEIFQL